MPQFLDRIGNPEDYIIGEDGRPRTHRMSWTEADGKFYAYPNVVKMPDGKLKQFDEDSWDAFDYNKSIGNFMEFDTAEEAAAYAEGGYKTDDFKNRFLKLGVEHERAKSAD